MSSTMQDTMQLIRKYAPNFTPKIGIILGSGLASITEQLTQPIAIPYQTIPGLQAGTVRGHASLLVLGYLNGVPVACLKGRLHLYEGTSYESVRTLVRMVKMLGAESLVITGAAGSLRPQVGPGELVLINDHINMQPGNPLVGPNDETVGPRFVSLEDAYDPYLSKTMLNVANRLNLPMHTGVYLSTLGPCFETPAEIKAYRMLGADVIGMSVVPEVLIARHCNMKVVAVTAITNLAVGLSEERVTHEGTLHYGELTARKLVKIIPDYVKVVSQ